MAAFFAARERWLMSQPGQAGLLASQVHWTAEVERAFDAASRGGKRGAMRAQHRRQAAALAALVEATRRPLSPADRQRVMNQITMDAHARDVVEGLASTPEGQGIILAGGGAGGGVGGSGSSGKKNNAAAAPGTAAASCFAWSCQLRAYWDPTLRDARVRICDASFDYGHEYLGSGPRLVITHLTDRVYVTATSAAWLCLGTAPAGPAGTGKTETTKDLAAALGRPIYVFNCSPEMDYRAMGDIFKGLASSGAWGCFDEFNRLVPEVLSVCSVQFKAVIDAQRKKAALPGRGLAHVDRATGRLVPALPASDFSFVAADGTTMPLEEGCAVFITMNPGYIGRAGKCRPSVLGRRAVSFHSARAAPKTRRDPCAYAPPPPNLPKKYRAPRIAQGPVPPHHRGRARSAINHGEHAYGRGLRDGKSAGGKICRPLRERRGSHGAREAV